MAEEDGGGSSKSEADKPGSNKNPFISIVLLANAVGLVSIAYMQFKAHQREATRPSIRDVVKAQMKELENEVHTGEDEFYQEQDKEGKLLPLDGFTANLAQGDGPRRFIRLNAVLKFSKDSQEEEFKARKPQIRDAIISILNSKRPEDLLKLEGKNYLKEEVKAAINSFLIDGHVVDVYYVGFQIQ